MRQNRTRLVVTILVALGMLTLGVTTVRAGGMTLEERVERLERKMAVPTPASEPYDDSALQGRLDTLEGHLKNLPFGLKIGGMVVASYQYNFNNPASNRTSLRSMDGDHNTFSLDLAQIQISREANEYGVGFMTKLNFGKVAERMAADWDGDGTIGNTSEESNSIEIQEAYITWTPPGWQVLTVKAGKFVTLLGAEVIESPRNYNISRSLLFGSAGPFTNTGALFNFDIIDEVKLTVGIVNGWNNVIDSNDGKSFMGQLALYPVDMFWMTVSGVYGAEQANRGDSKRGLIDVVANIEPIENLNINLNYDYGSETNLGLGKGTTAEWQVFSGIVAYDIPNLLQVPIGFAVRGEYFDDSDNTRLLVDPSGMGSTAFGLAQNAYEVTATFKIQLAEGLMFRTEYRYDWATRDLYEKEARGSGRQDDQQTIAGELSYVF